MGEEKPKLDKNNFFIKSQIQSSIRDVKAFLETGVFNAPVLKVFQEPVFISIILKLDDLFQKYRIIGKRITFSEDIERGDITDLVNKIRNAICHKESDEIFLNNKKIKFVFNIIVGEGAAISIEGEKIKSDYKDEIAFFYGGYRLYYHRHLIRGLIEAIEIAKELYPEDLMFLI